MHGHLHHEYDADYRRDFHVATAQEAADAWATNAGAAGPKWSAKLQSTTKPIVAAAVAQKQVAIQKYTDSLNSGRWENALNAVGDGGIKQAAKAKENNYPTGINAAKPKYLAKIGPLLNYIASGLPQLDGMASGTTEAGVARATYWIRYMAGAKGL